jgi:hypothetical protein
VYVNVPLGTFAVMVAEVLVCEPAPEMLIYHRVEAGNPLALKVATYFTWLQWIVMVGGLLAFTVTEPVYDPVVMW